MSVEMQRRIWKLEKDLAQERMFHGLLQARCERVEKELNEAMETLSFALDEINVAFEWSDEAYQRARELVRQWEKAKAAEARVIAPTPKRD